MKTAGIIAEYNPFHSGHRYQLDQIRARTGADYLVVVMSGDFVQRGEPAIYDKYTRTAIALHNGADLVLEMPCGFATSSAEDFAACGAALLDRLGVVDYLCFGSETGDLSLLQEAAGILSQEPEEYQNILRARLKDGVSFPKAREEALCACLSEKNGAGAALALPNNILGIEYLKALQKRGSRIRPMTVKRVGQGYHDDGLGGDSFPSASGIRNAVRQGSLDYFSCPEYHGMDDASLRLLLKTGTPVPMFADDLTGILNWRLLEMIGQGVKLSDFADLSSELEARLVRQGLEFATFSGRVEQLKTKQYTYTRISRALLHLLLGITKEELLDAKAQDYVSFARVLGFRRQAAPLLGEIKKNSGLLLLTKTADARRVLHQSGFWRLKKDFLASHLYQSLVFQKSGMRMKNEYTRSVILSD